MEIDDQILLGETEFLVFLWEKDLTLQPPSILLHIASDTSRF